MATKRATHARPIRRGNQEFTGRPEPGIPPSFPPVAHHHRWRPKRSPHRQRPHQPTHSHQLDLTDHTAGLIGAPSQYPHQAGTHPSRMDTCYGDPTTVRVRETTYGDLPPAGTGQGPLYIFLIIPNSPSPAATMPDSTLPPTLRFPAEDDHGAWHRYNRALHAILRRPDAPTLTTAMRRVAQACSMRSDTSHTGTPPDLTFQHLVHDISTTKEKVATLQRPSTSQA